MFKKLKIGSSFSAWTEPFADSVGNPIQARVNLKDNTFEYKLVIQEDYKKPQIDMKTLLVAEEKIKALSLTPVSNKGEWSAWTNPYPDAHNSPIQARKNLTTRVVELKLVIKSDYRTIYFDKYTVQNTNIMLQQVDDNHNLLALLEQQKDKIAKLELALATAQQEKEQLLKEQQGLLSI